jgi:uncharacterized SAM-binding protein YcdF (DUF218 family)
LPESENRAPGKEALAVLPLSLRPEARARGRRWLAIASIVVAAVAFAYVLRVPILEAIGHYLVVEEPLEPADAIIVPSGSFPDRILEAVTLYQQGFAPRILLCRERENPAFRRLREMGVGVPHGYDLNRSVAEQLGVPPEALVVINQPPGSTSSEARRVLGYARERDYRTLLVVTSKYHTRRASYIYRHLAGDTMRFVIRPAREDAFRPDAWWRNRAMTRRVVIEYQKLLFFLVLDRWRIPALRPAS